MKDWEKIEITDEEDKELRHCYDYCPIFDSIQDYNKNHEHHINCSTMFCEQISKIYVWNKREELKEEEE